MLSVLRGERLIALAIAWLTQACDQTSAGPPESDAGSKHLPSVQRDPTDQGSNTTVTASIAIAGGRLRHPSGALLEVPEGALSRSVDFEMADPSKLRRPGGGDELWYPIGYKPCGPLIDIRPHRVELERPVDVTVPSDACSKAEVVGVLSLTPRGHWKLLDASVDDGMARVETSSLSYFVATSLSPEDDGCYAGSAAAAPAACYHPGVCGDERLEEGLGLLEECDGTPDCTEDCMQNVCADGYLGPNEQCDDGNERDGDGCESECTLPVPGTGTSPSDAGTATRDGGS